MVGYFFFFFFFFFFFLGVAMPWDRAEANIDLVDNWTKILGNHTIKFGTDLRRIRDDLFSTNNQSLRGSINFAENQTSIPGASTSWGNDVASLLLDQPSQVGRDIAFSTSPAYRQWWFFAFAGDKWQVTPKLTVDIGVRWEFYPPATPQFAGGFSNYNSVNNTLVIAGIDGNPSNLGMKTHYDYFAPRLGASYRATSKTVVRAGFGISYTPFEDNSYAYNTPIIGFNIYSPGGTGYGPALYPGSVPATFQLGIPAPCSGMAIPPERNSHRDQYAGLQRRQPELQKPLRGVLEFRGSAGASLQLHIGFGVCGEPRAWISARCRISMQRLCLV